MGKEVEPFRALVARLKAEERRTGMSARFATGTRSVMPGSRTVSFASGIRGIVAFAVNPMTTTYSADDLCGMLRRPRVFSGRFLTDLRMDYGILKGENVMEGDSDRRS